MFVPQAVLSTKVPPVLYGSILSKFIEACGNLKGVKSGLTYHPVLFIEYNLSNEVQ